MVEITVGYAAVATCSQEMQSASKNIESRLNELTTMLRHLQWENDARDAYTRVESDMKAAVEDMKQILAQISQAVSDAHDGYQQMEARGASAWGG